MQDVQIDKTAVVLTENIGAGTVIGPFTYIGPDVVIGSNCKIFGASIGLPGEHPSFEGYFKGKVIIGDNVEIREFVTVNTSLFSEATVIGNNCYLMTKSHVGHDAILEERVVLHSGAIVGGHSIVGSYSYIGLNAILHPRAELGAFSILGAGNFYKGVCSTPALVWVGSPAKPVKVNSVGLQRHAVEEDIEFLSSMASNFIKTFHQI